MEPLKELHYDGRLLAVPTNIRLHQKGVYMVNTLAYDDTTIISATKIFKCVPQTILESFADFFLKVI